MVSLRSQLVALAAALAIPAVSGQDLEDFIAKQRPLSLTNVLNNLGAAAGAAPGLVIASPSRTDPPYYYTWTRDSALTFKMLIDEFIHDPVANANLEKHIRDYLRAQAILQTVANPSGALLPSGRGLGEAKYEVDGSRFNGAWGRPQRDGPPLRAVALITWANWLADSGDEGEEEARDIVWPVIANDLAYTGQYWNSTGFDLWEEVSGSSFFTTQAQYRALIEGAELAERLNTTCGPACAEAPAVGCFLNSDSYWNGRHHIANINTNTQRSGKDANTMLGANAAFDIAASCDSATIQPCHPRALASFKQWVDAWRDPAEYPINEGIPSNEGIAIGRYTEDIYYNGNPWYLITLGAGEFLFNAAHQWKAHGYINIDSTSLPFFQDLWPEAKVGTFKRPCSKNPKAPFNVIVEAANRYGDSFLSVAQKYTPADGSLAEQYNRDPPFEPQSARDLTWSYAAFVTAAARRAGEFPPTWVPAKLPIPSTCAASSARGTYTPATAAGAPDLGEVPCAAPVTFRVDARTYYGEDIYVVGGAPSLGNWNVENAQPLTADGYTDARPLWAIDVDLDAAGQTVTYQFVRRQNCGQGYIYETVNRTVDVPACGVTTPTVLEATWTGPVGTPGNC
ncbi:hypothetical protein VD0004_g5522 [Verticillium dahliae]|nr:hypothetical protein VD0004_g5522 [Verticillium dahliae]PNH71893.1 hypothetical protein VD0001_g5640 [Verticillium dahliae]